MCHCKLNPEKLSRGIWHRRVAFTVTNDTKVREAQETAKPHVEIKDLGPLTAESDKTVIVLDRGEAENLKGMRKLVFRAVLFWLKLTQYAPIFIKTRRNLRHWHRVYLHGGGEIAALDPSSPPDPATTDPEIDPLPMMTPVALPFAISNITTDAQ